MTVSELQLLAKDWMDCEERRKVHGTQVAIECSRRQGDIQETLAELGMYIHVSSNERRVRFHVNGIIGVQQIEVSR